MKQGKKKKNVKRTSLERYITKTARTHKPLLPHLGFPSCSVEKQLQGDEPLNKLTVPSYFVV